LILLELGIIHNHLSQKTKQNKKKTKENITKENKIE
jgi:hypothetical protein